VIRFEVTLGGRRYRLGVRTRGSQPRDRGSNPRTATTLLSTEFPQRNFSRLFACGAGCVGDRGREPFKFAVELGERRLKLRATRFVVDNSSSDGVNYRSSLRQQIYFVQGCG
jgi:hypothetical protein